MVCIKRFSAKELSDLEGDAAPFAAAPRHVDPDLDADYDAIVAASFHDLEDQSDCDESKLTPVEWIPGVGLVDAAPEPRRAERPRPR